MRIKNVKSELFLHIPPEIVLRNTVKNILIDKVQDEIPVEIKAFRFRMALGSYSFARYE